MQKKHQRGNKGLTLVEVSLAVTLMLLLFIATMNLFVTSCQTAMQANAQGFAGADAANAMQRVVDVTRAAHRVVLPGESGFTGFDTFNANSFRNVTVDDTYATGVELVFAPTQAISVVAFDGSSTPFQPNDLKVGAAGVPSRLWIYRANADGSPNAASGRCFWIRGTENGVAMNRALINSVDTASPNGVWFERPRWISSPVVRQRQVMVRVRSSYFSPFGGRQTNDTSNKNNITQLTGRCVLVRNAE